MWSDPLYTDVLYIPDDIIAAFAVEARAQVEESRPDPLAGVAVDPAPSDPRAARRRRATRVRRFVLTTVVWLALIALGVATAVWTVESFYSAASMWTTLSFGGGALWVLGTAVALSYRFPPLPE
ncbi:MAG: hypothetical protein WD080_03070 [Egibacteraceae bacterium]